MFLLKKKILKILIYDYITKLNISSIKNIINIKKINSYIYISTISGKEDKSILNALSLFDFMFGKKTELKKFESKYIKKKDTNIFIIKNDLRTNKDIIYFFAYFKNLLLKILNKKIKKIKYKYIKEGNYIYVEINDLTIFRNLPDNLKRDKIKIFFCIYFSERLSEDDNIHLFLSDFLSIK